MADEDDDPQALSFGQVVAENVRRLRVEKGLSQQTLAGILSLAGPPWTKTNVVALERGRKTVTDRELIQLAVALSEPVSELYAGRGDVEFGSASIDRTVIYDAFRQPKTPDVGVLGEDLMKPFAVDIDVLSIEIADRIGRPFREVQEVAQRLYGRSVTAEHRARVQQSPPVPGQSDAISRGNHTRAIANDIKVYIAEGEVPS